MRKLLLPAAVSFACTIVWVALLPGLVSGECEDGNGYCVDEFDGCPNVVKSCVVAKGDCPMLECAFTDGVEFG